MGTLRRQKVESESGGVPFLRWPGGKRWAASHICRIICRHLRRTYYEPFLGGGAIFFSLCPRSAVLADINEELITTYEIVRDQPERLLQVLRAMPVSSDFYYSLRNTDPKDPLKRAARLLYLNRTAFAGMYRLNGQGRFNVPYGGGQRTPAMLWEKNLIFRASQTLQHARLRTSDFATTIGKAGRGDVVYCDPTYTVAHDRNAFVRYNERNFSWADQLRLAQCATRAAARGATVMISNAHHPSTRGLYNGAHRRVMTRRSLISTDPSKRRGVSEYLFILRAG